MCIRDRVLLGLAHQYSNLLGEGVAGGAQILGLLNGIPVLPVQVQNSVHQGEFFALKLLFYIFLYHVGVFTD